MKMKFRKVISVVILVCAISVGLHAQTDTKTQTLETLKVLRDAISKSIDELTAAVNGTPTPPVVTSAVIAAHTAAEFQAALNTANASQAASTIKLDSGTRYIGNFLLPARAATAGVITVTSTSGVPAAGIRVTPTAVLAEVVTTNNVPAIDGPAGVHQFALIGLRIGTTTGNANDLVRFGSGEDTQASVYPGGFLLDRVIIRGDPTLGAKRGILANANNVTIINSDIRDIYRDGQDTTTIGCFNCGTGYTIKNNWLEAGAEVVIFGGAPSPANTIATDILFEGNTLTRPAAWQAAGHKQVKNLFELKEGLRVVIRGNIMFNNWVAAQPGISIVITPRDTNKYIQDVLIENNIVYNIGATMSISSHDNYYPTPIGTNKISVKNNLFIINAPVYGGDGRLVLITGAPKDITFDHNTVIQLGARYSSIVAAYEASWPGLNGTTGSGGPVAGFVFVNNAVQNGEYGIIANGSMNGAGLSTWFPNILMVANVMGGYPEATWQRLYPAGNFVPAIADWPGLFVNYTAGDYHPSTLMPLGTDGKPVGVDFSKLPARLP